MAVSIPSALAKRADGSWRRSFPEEWVGTLPGKGERPEFRCDECEEELTVRCPKPGSTYTPNFAHEFGGERCVMVSGGGESKRHAFTKRAIEKILQVKKEQDIVLMCGHVWQIPVVWDHAEAEKYVPIKDLEKDRKPDIRCSYEGTPVFAVEVHYKNRVDAGKALDYKTINLPWVEVGAVDLKVIDVAARSLSKNPRPHIDDLAWVVVGAPSEDKHVLHVENMSFDKICAACREADRKRRIEAWNARLSGFPVWEKKLQYRNLMRRQLKRRQRRVAARLEALRFERELRRVEEKARQEAEKEADFIRKSAVVVRDLEQHTCDEEASERPFSDLILDLECGHEWCVPSWDRVETRGRAIFCMRGSAPVLVVWLEGTWSRLGLPSEVESSACVRVVGKSVFLVYAQRDEQCVVCEQLRLERERLERERLERFEHARLERIERERLEQELLERERLERLEYARLERHERLERLERERLERERLEHERLEREQETRMRRCVEATMNALKRAFRATSFEEALVQDLAKELFQRVERFEDPTRTNNGPLGEIQQWLDARCRLAVHCKEIE